MANQIITPWIVAREALMVLRNNCVMANLIHRDYKEDFVEGKGTVINIRKPAKFAANEFDRSVGIIIQDVVEGCTNVTLDTILDTSFEVTSEELTLSIDDFSKQLIVPAMQAFAQKIDTKILQLYKDIPYFTGTANAELDSVAKIIDNRKALNDKAVLPTDRRLVLGTMAESKLLQLEIFTSAEKVGDNGTALREASIGRKLGFDFFMDQNTPKHISGTPGGTPTATGVAKNMYISIANAGNNGTFKQGDLITIDTLPGQSFVVLSDFDMNSAGAGSVQIYPELPCAINAQKVTLVGSHINNLAFHKNAFAFVNRPLALPHGVAKEQKAIVSFEGFGLRVVFGYDISKKKDICSIDTICGFKTIYPELAVRAISQN